MTDTEKTERPEDVGGLLIRVLAALDTDGEHIAGAHVAMAIAALDQSENGCRPPGP